MKIPKAISKWYKVYVLIFALAIVFFPTRLMLFSWPLLFGLVLFILCRNKLWILALLLVLVHVVPIIGFFHGIEGYVFKTGKICYMGDLSSHKIHPELRCGIRMQHDSTGLVMPWYLAYYVPRNVALAGSIRMFGKFPGSYLGPLPDKNEAIQLLNTNSHAVTAVNDSNGLIIDGKEYQLSDQFIRSNMDLLSKYPNSIIGTAIDDQCLVIGMYYEMDDMQPWIFVYVVSTGKRLARYIVRE